MKRTVILNLILVTLFLVACSSGQAPTTIAPEQPPEADPELQQRRLTFINDLIDEGIFSKVEVPASLPHVWVTLKFHLLSFDDKEASIGVVYAYYVSENAEYNIVVLYDNITGKEIGVFAEVYGGLKLE